jgi:predicted HTH domain antitoxin
MESVVITLDRPISEYVDRQSQSRNVSRQQTIIELVNLGFQTRLREYYQRYRSGEISFGRMAEEMGVTSWELSHLLEEHGWTPHNLPSQE